MIDNVDEEHAVRAGVEQIIVVWVYRKSLLDELVILALTVESTRDDRNLLTKVIVMSAGSGGDLSACTSCGLEGGSKG